MKFKRTVSSVLAALMVTSMPFAVSAEDKGPQMNNPSFENDLIKTDIQLYKAERTTAKASDGSYSIKVGNPKPEDPADVPMWLYNAGKGMVNVVIRNVKPNTTYEITCDYFNEAGGKMSTGVLDIQGLENNNTGWNAGSPWKLASDIKTNQQKSTEWKTNTHRITTGPRTNEIYAFAYTEWTGDENGSGVFYYDNVTIKEVQTNEDPNYIVTDYNPQTAAEFPETIPAIQEFTDKTDDFFYLNKKNQTFSADEESYEKAKYLADCMVSKGIIESYTLNKVASAEDGKGIIVVKQPIAFTLPENVASLDSKVDAYQIDIMKDKILVYADDIRGVQNGTMTLLQAFAQRDLLPCGSVHDYTDQVIRGLQVDSGRRYYSIDWLKEQIEQMAYYKQNKLQLRLKDNEGIRYDSKVAPELVDRKGGFWTQEEVDDLVSYAAQFNIEVVPEIDFPGHSEQDGEIFPEWCFTETTNVLDITKEEVREYMFSIYEEAAEFFHAKTIHIGGDEYFQTRSYPSSVANPILSKWASEESGNPSANQYDAIKLFFNQASERLIDKGLKVLVWNDNIQSLEGAVPLSKDIIVDFWAGGFYGSIRAGNTANAGYKIMSSSSTNYHDLWPQQNNNKLDRPLPKMMYEEWSRYHYSAGSSYPSQDEVLKTNLQNSLGQMFPIWDDAHGYVPEFILSRTLMPRYATFAYKTWGAEYKNQEGYGQLERLMFALDTPTSAMREQVVLNVTEAELTAIAAKISAALEGMTFDSDVQAKADALAEKLDKIAADPTSFKAENGFYTDTLNEIIHTFENLSYVAPVDRSALEALYEANKDLAEKDYTGETWSVFKAALDNAAVVLADETATQETVDKAYETLKAAVDGLVRKEEEKPIDPTDPTDPEEPKDPENPDKENPDTGDSIPYAVPIVLVLAAGMTFIIRKRAIK